MLTTSDLPLTQALARLEWLQGRTVRGTGVPQGGPHVSLHEGQTVAPIVRNREDEFDNSSHPSPSSVGDISFIKSKDIDEHLPFLREWLKSPHDDYGQYTKVDWNTVTLFGRLPRKLFMQLRYSDNWVRSKGLTVPSSDVYVHEVCYEWRKALLYRMWWFTTLKEGTKRRLYHLVATDQGLNRLSQILVTADGIVSSILLSCWELSQQKRGFSPSYLRGIVRWAISESLFRAHQFEPLLKRFKKVGRKFLLAEPGFGTEEFPELHKPGRDSLPTKVAMYKLLPYIDAINGIPYGSQHRMFAALTFCQTRNQGQATQAIADMAAEDLKRVYTTPGEFAGGESDLEEIRLLISTKYGDLSGNARVLKTAQNSARISANSNACLEASRKDGGKASIVRDLYNEATMADTRLIDLETGHDTEEIPSSLGDRVLHHCLRKYRDGTPQHRTYVMSVLASFVLEPAKARGVASSSMEHATMLHPLSHFFLEVLGFNPETRSGVRSARHGWNFIESHRFVGGYGLSSDLKTSTDFVDWRVARCILERLGSLFGIPKWYLETCIGLLCGPRNFWYKGEFWFTSVRGIPMGDPVTKVVLSVIGDMTIMRSSLRSPSQHHGSVVGDDIIVIAILLHFLYEVWRAFRWLGMAISWDDAFISRRYVFFSEEGMIVPQSEDDLVRSVNKHRVRSRLPYSDAIKGRLLVNAMKNRSDFSYSGVGRYSALGKDMSYVQASPEKYRRYVLASLIQDVSFDSLNARECFPYFPSKILSTGKPIPFNHAGNFLRFISRHGKNRKIYQLYQYFIGESMRMVNGKSDHYAFGNFQTMQSLKHSGDGWICDLQRYIPPELVGKEVLVVPRSNTQTWQGLISRSRGALVTRSSLIAKMMAQLNIEAVIRGEDPVEWVKLRLSNWIDKCQAADLVELTPDVTSEFISLWTKTPWVFTDIKREPVYLREDVEDLIVVDYDLHVTLPCNSDFVSNEDTRKSGDELAIIAWLQEAKPDLQKDPIAGFTKHLGRFPRYLVSDDELILNFDLRKEIKDVIIVTDDLRLATAYATVRGPRLATYRVSCMTFTHVRREYWKYKFPFLPDHVKDRAKWEVDTSRKGSRKWEPRIPGEFARIVKEFPSWEDDYLVVDTGSLETYLEHRRGALRKPPLKGLTFHVSHIRDLKWDEVSSPLPHREREEVLAIDKMIAFYNGPAPRPLPVNPDLIRVSGSGSFLNP